MQSSLTMGGVSGTAPPRTKFRGKGTGGAIRLPMTKSEPKITRPTSQGETSPNPVMRGGLKMPLLDKAVLAVNGDNGFDERAGDFF